MEARKQTSLGLLVLLFVMGCAAARPMLTVPESLAASSAMEVKRNRSGLGPKPMRFGEWQVNEYDRKGLPRNRKWSVGSDHAHYGQSRGWARYTFVLTPSGREEWECDCQYRKQERSVGPGAPGESVDIPLTYEDSLVCQLFRAGDEEPWTLEVRGTLWIGGEGYRGTLSRGDRTLFLAPSHQITGLPSLPGPPLGYLFVRKGEEIGSAELIHPGFVRIKEEAAEDRDVIATAAAALLMQPTT